MCALNSKASSNATSTVIIAGQWSPLYIVSDEKLESPPGEIFFLATTLKCGVRCVLGQQHDRRKKATQDRFLCNIELGP